MAVEYFICQDCQKHCRCRDLIYVDAWDGDLNGGHVIHYKDMCIKCFRKKIKDMETKYLKTLRTVKIK